MGTRLALLALLAILAIGLAACPRPGGPEARPARPEEHVEASLLARLQLPPTPAAAPALLELERAAARGSCPAAWLRLRYLIDLFDHARLEPVAEGEAPAPSAAHRLLWRGLGLAGEPGRGRLATQLVFQGLGRAAAAVPPRCPQRREARAAATLLAADLAPRRRPADALAVALAYKALARSGSPLAPNATLRLLDWCSKALRLAAGGLPAQQQERLAQCLFPLFDADPAPYFAASPAERPPDPPWPLLARVLGEQRARLAGTRLGGLARSLAEGDERFLAAAASELPTPLDLHATRLPASGAGEPWDRTPVVLISARGFLVGGQVVLADAPEGLAPAIARRLRNDRRRRVAVACAAETPAEEVLQVARAARRAGATTLELGVAREVARRAPPGDVQALLGGGPVRRLEVIPASLALFSATTAAAPSRDDPQAVGYDPRTAEHELALLVGRAGLRLSSVDGALAPVPLAELPAALRSLARAYPDDSSLLLAGEGETTYGALVAAAAQARAAFPGLAVVSSGRLPVAEGDLSPVLRLAAGALVRVEPEHAGWRAQLRRCYLDAVRPLARKGRPAPTGTLVLETRRRRVRVTGGSLRDEPIRRCAARAPVDEDGPARLTATFSVGGSQP